MFTQCPHCLTLFRINSEQLKIAAGRVRCCQCHEVFNALEGLQETPSSKQTSEQPPQASDETLEHFSRPAEDDGLFTDTLNLDSDQLYEITRVEEGLEDSDLNLYMEQDDGLETEPDYFASSSESQMSALLDSDSSPMMSLTEALTDDATVAPISTQQDNTPKTPKHTNFAIDSDPSSEVSNKDRQQPEIEQTSSRPPTAALSSFTTKLKDEAHTTNQAEAASSYTIDEMFEKESVSYSSIAWGLAGLLLACALMLQLAWYYRDQVIQKEAGRQLLTQMCSIIGCSVPQRRDTSKILIEHRDLRAHPDIPNALLLQLNIVNRATFDQPYPKLHLSLFNDEEKLIADRTFSPQEYIPSKAEKNSLMRRSQSVQVSLELLDPGKDVTGFKFEFL